MATVTEILGAFYPDINEPIWLRTFDAKGIPASLKGFPQNIQTTRHELQADKALQLRLKELNEKQGIYFVVNSGGTHDKDITRVNAIFCEMDDKPIQRQHDIFDNESPWVPSIRIQTKKSVHAYWLLSESISTQDFLDLQQGLIAFYGSDTSIKNLSRVMRVPYFKHVSYDGDYLYQQITCQAFHPDMRYSLSELRQGFPYAAPKRVVVHHQPNGSMETLDDVRAELRARIMELPSWSVSGKWGCANGVCHNGEGDTGLRVDLASGRVTCWSNCSFKEILAAFGLELPSSRKFDYIPRKPQTSGLYEWYQEHKRTSTDKS